MEEMTATIEVDQKTVKSERFHSPLFLALEKKHGWSRRVFPCILSREPSTKVFEYTKDEGERLEKHFEMFPLTSCSIYKESFHATVLESGLKYVNFYLMNMSMQHEDNHKIVTIRTVIKEREYTGELDSVRTLEAFCAYAKTYLSSLLKAEKAKASEKSNRPDVVQLLATNEYTFLPGNNNDLDASNGQEDAFILYATLDLAKLFANKSNEVKSEFWFHPDEPVRYTIPSLNPDHLEKDRVCCSCTDGCVSTSCECKQATHRQFAKDYPEQAALASNGWYFFGRLNLTTPAHLEAVRKCKIKIFDCCADCKCNHNECTNSIVSRKMTNPMLVLNRNRVAKERTWKPRVYTLYEVSYLLSLP